MDGQIVSLCHCAITAFTVYTYSNLHEQFLPAAHAKCLGAEYLSMLGACMSAKGVPGRRKVVIETPVMAWLRCTQAQTEVGKKASQLDQEYTFIFDRAMARQLR